MTQTGKNGQSLGLSPRERKTIRQWYTITQILATLLCTKYKQIKNELCLLMYKSTLTRVRHARSGKIVQEKEKGHVNGIFWNLEPHTIWYQVQAKISRYALVRKYMVLTYVLIICSFIYGQLLK